MRPQPCWAALCLVLGYASGVFAQEQEFPYRAHVLADDVYVRSGPGKSYYPTDKLGSGDEVEVYRHDPGGWLAIRPPEGSFSWVSARFLRPLGDGLGVVTGDEVVSRVGSRFSNVRDAIQVRLEKGEKVELLEEQTSQGQLWYKISPPAGEFRWISASYINREVSATGLSTPHSLTNLAPESEIADEAAFQRAGISTAQLVAAQQAIERRLAEADAETQAETQLVGYDQPENGYAVQTAQYEQVLPSRGPTQTLRPRETTARLAPPVAPERSWSGAGETSVGARVPLQVPKGGLNFAAELATIDIDLGNIITAEPTNWNFADISARLEILSRVSTTALQRGQVREMQEKVARLEEIRLRNLAMSAGRPLAGGLATAARIPPPNRVTLAPRGDASATAVTAGSNTTLPFIGAAAGSATAPSEFDGEGVLRPVVSKRRDAPRFALVDDAGNVSSFVTPAPGLNLQPYVGQKVGLLGTRGFMQELRKPHVMAKRVSLLDKNARR